MMAMDGSPPGWTRHISADLSARQTHDTEAEFDDSFQPARRQNVTHNPCHAKKMQLCKLQSSRGLQIGQMQDGKRMAGHKTNCTVNPTPNSLVWIIHRQTDSTTMCASCVRFPVVNAKKVTDNDLPIFIVRTGVG
ncbi:hypothetical protein BaRGS_00002173 [Batillaria attramentaria]|uniref:Uncharacterized protein n=1 Tax=Batillaria attramentaria TaxID=370345 RepID=A0ABD0M5G4_9CAEN